MAEQAEVTVTRSRAKSPRTRRAKNGHVRRAPARRTTPKTKMSELESIIASLEARVAQLTNGNGIRSTIHGATNQVGRAVTQASNQVGDMVADKLTNVASHFRDGANSVTGAARAGTGAVRKVGMEVERHPFMTVAIALGIGFLAGMVGRQET